MIYQDYLIVFDLFGVVFSKGLQSSVGRLVATLNRSEEKISNAYRKWEIPFDQGKIDEKLFWAKINHELGTTINSDTLSNIVLTAYRPQPETIQLAKYLKRNFNVIVYSNYRQEWFNKLDKYFDVSSNFNEIYISSEYGFLKPSIEVFDFLSQKYSVQKRNLILIDDEIENVLGVQAWGGTGIHFKTAFETEIEIRELIKYSKPEYDYYYSGILLKTTEGAYILQRRENKSYIENPGMLSVFGGKAFKNESPLSCAKRELKEETGLEVPNDKIKFVQEFGYPKNDGTWTHCTYYLIENVDINEIKVNEGQGIEILFPNHVLQDNDLTTLPRILIRNLEDSQQKGH